MTEPLSKKGRGKQTLMELYQKKIRDWLQRLHHLQGEIVQLKTALAESLSQPSDKKTVEDAEHFQTQFLKQDAAISLLRHELATRLNASGVLYWVDGIGSYNAMEQETMERTIATMEEGAAGLKRDFYDRTANKSVQ